LHSSKQLLLVLLISPSAEAINQVKMRSTLSHKPTTVARQLATTDRPSFVYPIYRFRWPLSRSAALLVTATVLPSVMIIKILLATFLGLTFLQQVAEAFVSPAATTTTGSRLHPRPFGLQQAAFDNLEDYDEARRSFEHLLKEHNAAAPHHDNNMVHHDHDDGVIMSSASRRRKQLEIELLQSLQDSDDALDELIYLWMQEADPHDAQALQDMQEECSTGLVKEEALLRKMIEEHGTWCEPCIRLATLLFYKGRTEESFALAHRARELKVRITLGGHTVPLSLPSFLFQAHTLFDLLDNSLGTLKCILCSSC
jgi:hypothetical protein